IGRMSRLKSTFAACAIVAKLKQNPQIRKLYRFAMVPGGTEATPATGPCKAGSSGSEIAFKPGLAKLAMMIKIEKPPADLELKRRIQELIDYKGGGFNQEHVADLIENALKILTDVEDSGDVKVIQTAVR